MSPGQNNLPSKSIKEVPGRSKLRVESINPVPTGNSTRKPSKVKLISPEEAMRLSSGVTQMAVSPPRPKFARATPQAPRPFLAQRAPEAPRPVWAPPISEPPKPVLPHRPPQPPPLRPFLAHRAPEAPRPVLVCPISGPPRKEIVCGLRAFSLTTQTVRQRKTNSSHLQAKTVEPPLSPRALEIASRVKQQGGDSPLLSVIQKNPPKLVEVGTGDTARDHVAGEKRKPKSEEELSELLRYLPAMHPTWKGRIVDSATSPEFDCEFWGIPASYISKKAHKLSDAIPALLKVELLPTGNILSAMFGKIPTLSNVQVYLFPDEKKTERFNGEHARLFEAMATRNGMIKVIIKDGTELLIFSSKHLNETSQYVISKQKKTENFLWGCFHHTKASVALVPRTCHQSTDKDADHDGDVVDMDIDTKFAIPPGLALKLTAESQRCASSSQVKVKGDESLPPGFEKKWLPPLVKLNIQATSSKSEQSGLAGLVRDQTGKWVFGYTLSHKNLHGVSAELVAIYNGLNLLWDSGFRKIHLETTNREILDVLTTNTNVFPKRRSILDRCKDLILREWECGVYHISKEENSCAEWLASKVEEEPQGLIFFEYPPRGLLDRLETDRIAFTKASSA